MQGTVLYGPGDIRFEEREIRRSWNPVMRSSAWLPRAYVDRPVAIQRLAADQWSDAHGTRVLRHRGRGRERGQICEARPICHRFVCGIGR